MDGMLYLEDKAYSIKVYGFTNFSSSSDLFNIKKYKNNQNRYLLNNINKNLITRSNVEINEKDKMLLLSTCIEYDLTKRSILVTKLTSIDIEYEK